LYINLCKNVFFGKTITNIDDIRILGIIMTASNYIQLIKDEMLNEMSVNINQLCGKSSVIKGQDVLVENVKIETSRVVDTYKHPMYNIYMNHQLKYKDVSLFDAVYHVSVHFEKER
jgi:hypothetical protein